MFDVFAYLNVTAVIGVLAFIAGVVFSQRIKDWVAGVPSDLRAGLNDLETKVKASVAHETQAVLSTVHRAVPLPATPPDPTPPAPLG